MARRNTGSIIMITSMAALFGIPLVSAYSASKAALGGLARQLAVEFGPLGIRVNAIAPGFIETDMNRDIFRQDPERLKKVLGRTPLGCLGRPEDVAETAVFLASPQARYLTGVTIPVDGGTSIGF
jgi:gluconate 5-dehydrogenase